MPIAALEDMKLRFGHVIFLHYGCLRRGRQVISTRCIKLLTALVLGEKRSNVMKEGSPMRKHRASLNVETGMGLVVSRSLPLGF